MRNSPSSLGYLPQSKRHKSVAIIGGGICGIVAAYELLRSGMQSVTIFEACKERLGGRCYSQKFIESHPCYIAELGAMRFSRNQVCLFHYLEKFNISTNQMFPNPGVVDTEIHYQGNAYSWKKGEAPPLMFEKLYIGWTAFLRQGVKIGGVFLAGPEVMRNLSQQRKHDALEKEWKKYIDIFSSVSFYNALVMIFTNDTPPGGEKWSIPEDFDLFGLLGIGTGGMFSVYQVSFIEILCIIVSGFEVDQLLINGGISSLVECIADQSFNGICLRERVCYQKVVAIDRSSESNIVLILENGIKESYDRVIITVTPRAMQVGLKGDKRKLFNSSVITAINQSHMISSSKIFILCQEKFWKKYGLPQTIQSDQLVKAVYCLDYLPEDDSSYGVVLLNYTWEEDSYKFLSVKDKVRRFKTLVDDLAIVAPYFSKYLRPVNDDYERYIICYDWLMDEYSLGAFKLQYPGRDHYTEELFFQFKTANFPEKDKGIYLAGCSCSFHGGWIEGAIITALNSVCSVIRSCGGSLVSGNPLDNLYL